jgi:hypothetical protein
LNHKLKRIKSIPAKKAGVLIVVNSSVVKLTQLFKAVKFFESIKWLERLLKYSNTPQILRQDS